MISDKAKGLSGSTHVAHTQKLIDESTERYHHSCLAAGLTIKKTGNKGKPRGIICNTIKGKGISFMENNNQWHHGRLTESLYQQSLLELQ